MDEAQWVKRLLLVLVQKLGHPEAVAASLACAPIFYHLLKTVRSKHETFPLDARLVSLQQLINVKLSFRASLKRLAQSPSNTEKGEELTLPYKPLILLGKLTASPDKPEQLQVEDATGSIPCLVIHARPGLLGQWVLFDRWALVLCHKQALRPQFFEIDCRNAQVLPEFRSGSVEQDVNICIAEALAVFSEFSLELPRADLSAFIPLPIQSLQLNAYLLWQAKHNKRKREVINYVHLLGRVSKKSPIIPQANAFFLELSQGDVEEEKRDVAWIIFQDDALKWYHLIELNHIYLFTYLQVRMLPRKLMIFAAIDSKPVLYSQRDCELPDPQTPECVREILKRCEREGVDPQAYVAARLPKLVDLDDAPPASCPEVWNFEADVLWKVTNHIAPAVFVLDNNPRQTLYLTRYHSCYLTSGMGLRVGATIRLHNIHLIDRPPHKGFGACACTHVEITCFSSLRQPCVPFCSSVEGGWRFWYQNLCLEDVMHFIACYVFVKETLATPASSLSLVGHKQKLDRLRKFAPGLHERSNFSRMKEREGEGGGLMHVLLDTFFTQKSSFDIYSEFFFHDTECSVVRGQKKTRAESILLPNLVSLVHIFASSVLCGASAPSIISSSQIFQGRTDMFVFASLEVQAGGTFFLVDAQETLGVCVIGKLQPHHWNQPVLVSSFAIVVDEREKYMLVSVDSMIFPCLACPARLTLAPPIQTLAEVVILVTQRSSTHLSENSGGKWNFSISTACMLSSSSSSSCIEMKFNFVGEPASWYPFLPPGQIVKMGVAQLSPTCFEIDPHSYLACAHGVERSRFANSICRFPTTSMDNLLNVRDCLTVLREETLSFRGLVCGVCPGDRQLELIVRDMEYPHHVRVYLSWKRGMLPGAVVQIYRAARCISGVSRNCYFKEIQATDVVLESWKPLPIPPLRECDSSSNLVREVCGRDAEYHLFSYQTLTLPFTFLNSLNNCPKTSPQKEYLVLRLLCRVTLVTSLSLFYDSSGVNCIASVLVDDGTGIGMCTVQSPQPLFALLRWSSQEIHDALLLARGGGIHYKSKEDPAPRCRAVVANIRLAETSGGRVVLYAHQSHNAKGNSQRTRSRKPGETPAQATLDLWVLRVEGAKPTLLAYEFLRAME